MFGASKRDPGGTLNQINRRREALIINKSRLRLDNYERS